MDYHCRNKQIHLQLQNVSAILWGHKITIVLVFSMAQYQCEGIAGVVSTVTVITLFSSLPWTLSLIQIHRTEFGGFITSCFSPGFWVSLCSEINELLLYFFSAIYKKYDDVPKQLLFACSCFACKQSTMKNPLWLERGVEELQGGQSNREKPLSAGRNVS